MAVDTATTAPAGKISGAIGIRAAAFRSGGEEARFNNSGSGSRGPDSDRHPRSLRPPDLKRRRGRSALALSYRLTFVTITPRRCCQRARIVDVIQR